MEAQRTILIPKTLQQEIIADVQQKYPEEACGLLAGWDERVEKIYTITNSAHSPVRFFMAPEELLEALLEIEGKGWELIGIYHSHPEGPPHPSPTDLAEFAYPGAAYLICFQESGNWKYLGFDILPIDKPNSPIRKRQPDADRHFIPLHIQVLE